METNLLDEAMEYIVREDVLLSTRTDTTEGDTVRHIAKFKKRVGDELYECGGMGLTQAEAIVRAYIVWSDYWRPAGADTVRFDIKSGLQNLTFRTTPNPGDKPRDPDSKIPRC